MTNRGLSIAPGVVIELVGDEVVALVPGKAEVVKFIGETAKALIAIRDGRAVILSDGTREELLNSGLVSSPKALSRRALVRTGLVGAGAGVAVLAMPSVANAASPSGGGGSGRLPGFWYDGNNPVYLIFSVSYAANLDITRLSTGDLQIDGGVPAGWNPDSVVASGQGAALFRYTGGTVPASATVFTGSFDHPDLGRQFYQFTYDGG